MDEIKSVISELPSQDVIILKTLYNPEIAKGDLSENGQRLIPILDGLPPEEQQTVVDVVIQGEAPAEEAPIEEAPTEEMPAEEMPIEEEKPNPAGNLEDFLI